MWTPLSNTSIWFIFSSLALNISRKHTVMADVVVIEGTEVTATSQDAPEPGRGRGTASRALPFRTARTQPVTTTWHPSKELGFISVWLGYIFVCCLGFLLCLMYTICVGIGRTFPRVDPLVITVLLNMKDHRHITIQDHSEYFEWICERYLHICTVQSLKHSRI